MHYIQHSFICHLTDSTVSEVAGIEPRTVATTALAVRRSNDSLVVKAAISHPLRLHFIHTWLYLIQFGYISSTLGYISSTFGYISSTFGYISSSLVLQQLTARSFIEFLRVFETIPAKSAASSHENKQYGNTNFLAIFTVTLIKS